MSTLGPTIPSPPGPPRWAMTRAARLLARFPELDRKLVDRAASMRALAAMFRDAGSGGRGVATRPGEYIPSRTRGAAAELRSLLQHARDPNVTAVSLVPPSRRGRTPDMVVRYAPHTGRGLQRIEITSVMGGRAGYAPRGRGGVRPIAPADISARLLQKARHGQLTRPLSTPDLGPVPPRGTIDVVVPRAAPAVIRRAVAGAGAAIARQGPHVRRIIVRAGGGRPLTFVRRVP